MGNRYSFKDALEYHARKSKVGKVTIVFKQEKTGTPDEIMRFRQKNPNLKWDEIRPA